MQSNLFKQTLASLLAGALWLIRWTNPLKHKEFDIAEAYARHTPTIIALWHGQHLLIPFYYPRGKALIVMVSRSADAEMNALVVEKIGFKAVRGSGGRDSSRHLEKGGARALIALKKALDAGNNVAMIADIPHGTPRDAGLGIITLARLSGRPILPVALATSRRKVIEKSWDKTTISLPFGHASIAMGEPVMVPAGADDALMEEKRRELTASLNAATERAYSRADGQA
ncbi:lysophospholipid acyltransferase family protein [Mesorhizobium sp. BAC0120]|nr:lysophospholipid acyltransferase family protein [Mesorhizobium sp. BAC0120]MDW6024104.1 lysophospholipid acyltransferase family protein [Mesorhizobium sp. BAC0120]